MEIKTDGIVLNNYTVNENDNITVLFTEQIGKTFILSKSTKKLTSRLKPVLELFSLNHYYLMRKKETTKYFRLIQASQFCAYENIRASLEKIYLAYLIAELLDKFLPAESPAEELFVLTKQILRHIDSVDYANDGFIESFFKLKLLKHAGFNITDNKIFLSESKTKKEIRDYFSHILENTETIENMTVKDAPINEINYLIDTYIMYIIDDDIKSKKMLRAIK